MLVSCLVVPDIPYHRYIASRIFLHDPPGDDNAFTVHPDAPEGIKQAEWDLAHRDPETNPWVCIILLVIAVGIMAYTAEIVSCARSDLRMRIDLGIYSWYPTLNSCEHRAVFKKSMIRSTTHHICVSNTIPQVVRSLLASHCLVCRRWGHCRWLLCSADA